MAKHNNPSQRNETETPIFSCMDGDAPNLGLLFYKSTTKEIYNVERFNRASKKLIRCIENRSMDQYKSPTLETKAAFSQNPEFVEIELTTNYLGLVAGLGYSHTTKMSEEEVKLGFSFDFTSGLPYIPGSSVKGRLRSFFPSRYKDSKKKAAEVTAYLHSIFNELKTASKITSSFPTETEAFKEWAKKLEYSLFEGKDAKGDKRILSPLQQDTFFDAFPIAADKGKFIGTDTITPHAHPLKDPLPLRLLKILPGVTICFQFRLNDQGGLTAKEKEALFSFLLLRHGAGAKTRSGFGQFVDDKTLTEWKKQVQGKTGFVSVGDLPKIEPTSPGGNQTKQSTQTSKKANERRVLTEYIGKSTTMNPQLFKTFRILDEDAAHLKPQDARFPADPPEGKTKAWFKPKINPKTKKVEGIEGSPEWTD